MLDVFDVFGHTTQRMVNARAQEAGVSALSDAAAAAAVGRVEGKLVLAEVEDAGTTVTTMSPAVRAVMRPKLADLAKAMEARDEERLRSASADLAVAVKGLEPAQAAALQRHGARRGVVWFPSRAAGRLTRELPCLSLHAVDDLKSSTRRAVKANTFRRREEEAARRRAWSGPT